MKEINNKINIAKNLDQIDDINAFLRSFGEEKGYFLTGNVVTLEDWKKKRKLRKIYLIGYFFSILEFVFLRFLPKVYFFRFLYKSLGFKSSQYMSEAEILGRFIYNGFEIISFNPEISFHSYTIQKVSLGNFHYVPVGPLISLDRIGKEGKIIKVYKLRTMHSYSEYIHKYMIEQYGFNSKGKILNDFRITKWGRFLRKFWIDEIPQLYNLLRGDLKLVGLRPVGQAYFDELPQEIKEKRLKFKPGCIPPYVALNMQASVNEVVKADNIYMEKYCKNKFVDFHYFLLAIYCIIVKRKRSS